MKQYNLAVIIVVILSLSALVSAQLPIPLDYDSDVSLINQFPDPARAGDVVEIRINLENVGQKTLNDIMVELESAFPFTLIAGQEAVRNIKVLPAYPNEASSKILVYKLLVDTGAPDGKHNLKFRHSTNGGTFWTIETVEIDVTTKEFAQIIYIDKTRITPGKETEITFTITNIGKAPLTNMVFSWGEEDNVVLPVSTDNTRYINTLGAGESIDLKYTVIANPTAERGLYNLDLKLDFDTKNESGKTTKKEINTKAGVLVGGGTNFDAAFSESDGGDTSLSIANIGENDATSVTVSIPDQEAFFVQKGSSVIIGNLKTGDFTLATFRLLPTLPIANQETRNLEVVVSYTDSFGDRHSIQKNISLKISPTFGMEERPAQRESPINNFIMILVVLVILYVLYQRRKKGKPLIPFLSKKKGM